MDNVNKTSSRNEIEHVSFKKFFVPMTTFKAVFWLVIVGFVVFFNSLFNGFVWDDIGQVVNNGNLHNISNIFSFFFGSRDINGNIIKIHAAFYRPLMETLFTLVYSISGSNAFFFHGVSLLMQLAIVVLIYFLFRRFFNTSLAFLLALILLVHPLNSEAVDYISAYNDLMYLLFGMVAIQLSQRSKLSYKRLIILSVCLFFSLLSKETGFLFIPILISYSYLYNKKNLIKLSLSIAAVIIIYFVLRNSLYVGISEEQAFGFSPFLHMPFWLHLVNIPKIFTYYLYNFFYPDQLAIAQQWSVQKITLADFYLPLLILLIFISGNLLLLIETFKKEKEQFKSILFFSIWFWVGIGIYFQLVPLDMTVADRWFYFPMIGFLGLLGIVFQNIKIKKSFKSIVLSLVIFYIVIFSVRTIIRNTNWNSERSLYMHDIQITSGSFDLENQVGMIYFEDHNLPMAKTYFQNSISLYHCSDAVNNLGYLYQSLGNLQEAEKQYLVAVQCTHGYKDYGNLVLLLYKLHNYDLAEQYSKEAIQQFPDGAGLYFILGVLEDKKGNTQEALKNLATGYQLSHDPQISNAYMLVQQNKPVDLPL